MGLQRRHGGRGLRRASTTAKQLTASYQYYRSIWPTVPASYFPAILPNGTNFHPKRPQQETMARPFGWQSFFLALH